MMRDMPTISDASHSHSTYGLGNLATPLNSFAGTGVANTYDAGTRTTQDAIFGIKQQALFNVAAPAAIAIAPPLHKQTKPKEKPVTRRLVQVFIADPDENVPLEQSLLYTGSQKLTDATDQELFFEIDMKSILDSYNATRIKIVNKKVKERSEFLEPVKIRDLKMVVVNVATF